MKYCICLACTAGGWLLDHESDFWKAGTRSKTGLKIDRRDLRKPAGLELPDKSDAQTSDKINKGIVKRLSNMFMESRFTIPFYKKRCRMQKLWKSCQTQLLSGEKGEGRELCSLSAKMATPFSSRCESLQGFTGRQESWTDSRDCAIQWDCRSKAECSLLQKASMLKLVNRKNATRFPFWRERGTSLGWWIVDCYMLEHRKACQCFSFEVWLSCLPISSFRADWRNDKGLSFLPSSP